MASVVAHIPEFELPTISMNLPTLLFDFIEAGQDLPMRVDVFGDEGWRTESFTEPDRPQIGKAMLEICTRLATAEKPLSLQGLLPSQHNSREHRNMWQIKHQIRMRKMAESVLYGIDVEVDQVSPNTYERSEDFAVAVTTRSGFVLGR